MQLTNPNTAPNQLVPKTHLINDLKLSPRSHPNWPMCAAKLQIVKRAAPGELIKSKFGIFDPSTPRLTSLGLLLF